MFIIFKTYHSHCFQSKEHCAKEGGQLSGGHKRISFT